MRISQQNDRLGLRSNERREVIRGASEQVIRVRVPVPGVFREAVFFLHEDYLRRSNFSREELLRQAKRSAEDYLRPLIPQKSAVVWWPYPLLLLVGTALGLGLGVYIGL